MIDKRLASAIDVYARLARDGADAQTVVGRQPSMAASEEAIFDDVRRKLALAAGQRVLCIGIGAGSIARRWLDVARDLPLQLTGVDVAEVVALLRRRVLPEVDGTGVHLIEGVFPFDCGDTLTNERFERIELYSVIHYSDRPRAMIDAAAALLAPAGRLLVGDIPNLDRKGRFLATPYGRAYEAAYRGVAVDEIPAYASASAYAHEARAAGAAPLDDRFVLDVVRDYRAAGFDAFVVDQPSELPFCLTREDIIIGAPYA